VLPFVFYSFGLGLYGKLQSGEWVLIAVGLYIIQIFVSRWWLSRYRYGPAEWLWRSLTYGKAQPMRRSTGNAYRSLSATEISGDLMTEQTRLKTEDLDNLADNKISDDGKAASSESDEALDSRGTDVDVVSNTETTKDSSS
jgi:hypothetical protein